MKVLIVGDVHYSQFSSIVRRRGEYYSKRLENLLWSINWAEKEAINQGAQQIIYLGDFFDRADLNAEELTAFRDIIWAKDILHTFIVGNHETASRTLEYSSAHLITSLGSNFEVIDKPTRKTGFGYEFIYLPYIFESERKPLDEYIEELRAQQGFMVSTRELKQLYIFSHNDIKGVQYGMFESKNGFDKDEILGTGCRYFINGHIHNQGWVTQNRILNLGNLTGQNFNEDGFVYPHSVLLLDTRDESIHLIENPYALKFVKQTIQSRVDLENLKIPTHAVFSVKCVEELVPELREILDADENVEEYKIISTADQEESEEVEDHIQVFNSVDHLQQFQSYIIEQLGKTDLVLKELQEVVK